MSQSDAPGGIPKRQLEKVAVPYMLPNGHPSANISPGRDYRGNWRGYDVAGVGEGEFALQLVLHQRVAPLYWRSDTHTHIRVAST